MLGYRFYKHPPDGRERFEALKYIHRLLGRFLVGINPKTNHVVLVSPKSRTG